MDSAKRPKSQRLRTIGRRALLRGLGIGVAVAPAVLLRRHRLFAQSSTQYSSRAVTLMRESIVIDLLNQFMRPHRNSMPPKIEQWLSRPETFTDAEAAVFVESGIRVFALGGGSGAPIFNYNNLISGSGGRLLRIDSISDIERAQRERKIGIMLTIQDSPAPFSPEQLPGVFKGGLRIAQLTSNDTNKSGSGFLADSDDGMTDYGRSVMKRMEEVGVGVDVSHCGDRTTLDALEAATKPVLFTHANCRALVPGHMRLKTDEMLVKMAKTGGMMGMTFVRNFIRDHDPTTLDHLIDHFDYARRLIGIQHLAIGSDLDVLGYSFTLPEDATVPYAGPKGKNAERYHWRSDPVGLWYTDTIMELAHSKRMFDLTDGLIRRGYTDEDIKLILGGNAMRVLGNIWPKAASN